MVGKVVYSLKFGAKPLVPASRDFLRRFVCELCSSRNEGSILLFEVRFLVLFVFTGEGILIGRAECESLLITSARLFCIESFAISVVLIVVLPDSTCCLFTTIKS